MSALNPAWRIPSLDKFLIFPIKFAAANPACNGLEKFSPLAIKPYKSSAPPNIPPKPNCPPPCKLIGLGVTS